MAAEEMVVVVAMAVAAATNVDARDVALDQCSLFRAVPICQTPVWNSLKSRFFLLHRYAAFNIEVPTHH
jgi:hypothetical protein